MAGRDSSERSLRIASMQTMLDYHWMFLRTLSSSVREYLGEAGLAALERGFRRAGVLSRPADSGPPGDLCRRTRRPVANPSLGYG